MSVLWVYSVCESSLRCALSILAHWCMNIISLSKSERKLLATPALPIGSPGMPGQVGLLSGLPHLSVLCYVLATCSCSGVLASALSMRLPSFFHSFPKGMVSTLSASVSENSPAWPSGRHWFFHSSELCSLSHYTFTWKKHFQIFTTLDS